MNDMDQPVLPTLLVLEEETQIKVPISVTSSCVCFRRVCCDRFVLGGTIERGFVVAGDEVCTRTDHIGKHLGLVFRVRDRQSERRIGQKKF
jgi:hypothetical protein